MLALLTFKNWQRAGAAAQLTVEEYHRASRVGDLHVRVLIVKELKTGIKGSAKLAGDAKRPDRYYRYIHPKLDPAATHQQFLLLPGGKPL